MAILARNKAGLLGFVVFAAFVITSFVGPLFVPQTLPTDVKAIYLGPSAQHPLGTDSEGRDILIQMINGGQSIILVGALAALLSTLISITFGALAAYLGGLVDGIIMLIADVVLTLPQIVLLIVLGAVGLLVVLSPGTPEFAVTLLTLLIGLIFIAMVAVLVRLAGR